MAINAKVEKNSTKKIILVLMNADKRSLYYEPPLNLGMLASYLEKHMGFHDTKIVDMNFIDDYMQVLKDINPEIVGITSTTLDFQKTIRIATDIKKYLKIPVIIGGVHISVLPNCLRDCFDIGVLGEGEETLKELLELWLSKKKFEPQDLKNVKGIVYHGEAGKLVVTEEREFIKDMTQIPVHDKKYIDPRHYQARFNVGGYYKTFSMSTARGCPFACSFCSISATCRRSVRYLPVENIVTEIKDLVENKGIEFINISDPTFSLNKPRIKELIAEMRKHNLLGKVKFEATARANLIDDEYCELFKEMGIVKVGFGFESGSDRMVKKLKKNVTLKQNQEAIKLTKKHGFIVMGSLIMASPGETLKDMQDTIEFIKFAKKHKLDAMWIRVMTPFPGTEVWDIAEQRGKVSSNMNFEILSQENVNNPMLLDSDITIEEFKKKFYEARKELGSLRANVAIRYFLQNPLAMIKEIISKPRVYLETAKQIFFHKNKYNVAYEEDKFARPDEEKKYIDSQ